jgi:hypothetical protein
VRGVLFLALALLSPGHALAQTKAQDIDALLAAVQWERQVDAGSRVMRAAFLRGMKNRAAGKSPEFARLVEQEYDATFPVAAVVAELKPRVVKLYDDRFTHEEIRELTAIYRTPVYVKHRAMGGELGQLILTATQDFIRAGMGDLMKRVTDRTMAQKGGK